MLTVSHPWHGVNYGKKAPATVNALIEIPQGSRSKYEVDKESGLLKLDRVIYSSFQYPVNYGFIPRPSDWMGIRWIFWYSVPNPSAPSAWWKPT
jgi:hypothetical protein